MHCIATRGQLRRNIIVNQPLLLSVRACVGASFVRPESITGGDLTPAQKLAIYLCFSEPSHHESSRSKELAAALA